MQPYFISLQGGHADGELVHVVRERDELKDALLDIEKHMEDIQDNVKTLSAERDEFKALFKRVRLQCVVSPTCPPVLFDAC